MKETWVTFLGQEDTLEEGMPGELYGPKSLVEGGYISWGHRAGQY